MVNYYNYFVKKKPKKQKTNAATSDNHFEKYIRGRIID